MSEIVTLPGLIDPHVHLRDPGQTHKEDFYTGTSAALAGGYTVVMDMPNNAQLIETSDKLDEKIESARKQAVCDIGFHFGTLGNNTEVFNDIRDKVLGLKLYLNLTTGAFLMDASKILKVYQAWDSDKPILIHSHGEDDHLDEVIAAVEKTKQKTHICHLANASELKRLIKARDNGLPITCGVTAHHLFLDITVVERLGSFGRMLPPLQEADDVKFLWQHKDAIDMIESDHAPHTLEEKKSDKPPFGVPGLETTLPLLLKAEKDGKLSRSEILNWTHYRPAEIFGIEADERTDIRVSMEEYELGNEGLKTKAGWTPFAGMKAVGRIIQVDLRGTTVFKDGEVLAPPGSGQILP